MRVVPLVLLVALFAAPLVGAQLPTAPQACGPISIPNAPGVPPEIGPGGQATVIVEVVNDGPIEADVEVTALTSSAGWSVASTPPPAGIAAGATGRFEFVIAAGEGATDDATVSFSASGTCQTALPTCPGNTCNAGSDNTAVEIPFAPDEGFQIPGLSDLDIRVEYLIAGIVLVGLATAIPFAMRKRKGGIVADCPEPLKMVRAGRGTSFPIEIRNGSKDAATAAFEVGPVPEGWSAFMPLPEVQLASREARSLWLMVRSPATAAIGETVDVELRLRDPKRGTNGTIVRVRAEVQGGAEA